MERRSDLDRRWSKTLHTNRRPALGFGLSVGLLDAGCRYCVVVWAAVGELTSEVIRQEIC